MEKKITACDNCETPCIYPYYEIRIVKYSSSEGEVIQAHACSLKCFDELIEKRVE